MMKYLGKAGCFYSADCTEHGYSAKEIIDNVFSRNIKFEMCFICFMPDGKFLPADSVKFDFFCGIIKAGSAKTASGTGVFSQVAYIGCFIGKRGCAERAVPDIGV